MRTALTGVAGIAFAMAALLPTTAEAQTQRALTPRDSMYWTAPEDRRAYRALEDICLNISNRTRGIKTGYWRFDEKLLEAAGLPVTDSVLALGDDPAVAVPLRRIWLRMQDLLVCNSVQFDVLDGNILKYTVAMKFDDFLETAVWMGLYLNSVDRYDNRTVLDYVSYQLERNRGNPTVTRLQHYYDILREAGAKHRSELP